METRNGELVFRGQPFFPIGLVFGRTDADMQRAKSAGMNSIHQEYSLKDVMPDGPDQISEAGMQRIRELHETAVRNEMVFFPLINGHYIPSWLAKAAGPAPHDINNEKIGLWFRYSMHDPVFRQALEKYWRTVAKAVGNDPNAALFVNWNEPAYGLDATPAALAVYRAKMKETHGDIGTFNRAMRTAFKDFDAIVPPGAPDENRVFFYHWFRYNQQAFADFFGWQREIMRSEAPGIKLTGKHPVTALLGDALQCNDIPSQAAVQDVYGCDAYNGSLLHYRDAMEAARSLSGGGPVISYETHGQKGIPPLKPDHAVLQLFTQIIGGCRGLFFFCNGEQPQFGLFSDQATPPVVREKLIGFFKLIHDNQAAFAAPRLPAEIAVLLSNPSTIHYGAVPEPHLRDEYTRRASQCFDLIRNQHFAVDFIADSQLKSKLGAYKLLVIPSLSILNQDGLAEVEKFVKNGGRIMAFGKSLERDEHFKPLDKIPGFLGIDKRSPAPWNRGQMRLVEVAPELNKSFLTELIVQVPERINPVPLEQTIPGYIPKTDLKGHKWLAANQDAYPSIVMSADGSVVYCAFDSLYSEGLSALIGGIVQEELKLKREFSAVRVGSETEALELLGAVNGAGDSPVILLANAGPNPGRWRIKLQSNISGSWRELVTGTTHRIHNGEFEISLPSHGYCILSK